MSEHKEDEKWLDDRLQRAISGATPAFDARAWKQKYAKEYEAILARGQRKVGWGLPHLATRIVRRPFCKVALAAAFVIGAGILLTGRFGTTRPMVVSQPAAQESPAQMVSMISLSAAFRSGGMEGLNEQCDRALERLGPRPTSVSMQELLKDINGRG
jgi:hypothetical protein